MCAFRAASPGGGLGFLGGEAVDATVVSSRKLTPSIHEISLKKPGRFRFLPVQFTFLTLMTENGPDTRPMSLAASPTRPSLEYAVRMSDSPYKQAFASLRPGDVVMVRGPFGDFVLDESRPAVFVAGGIGITPLKGMAEYAADQRLSIPVRLLYSSRGENEIAYKEELVRLERQNPKFKVFHTLTGRPISGEWIGSKGRIGRNLLLRASEGLDRPIYYLCGRPSMVSGIYESLQRLKVPDEDMRYEVFRGYWN